MDCVHSTDVHLHHWGRCDAHLDTLPTIRYINDTFEAPGDAIRFTPVAIQFDTIWFNIMRYGAIRCDSTRCKIMIQFNMVRQRILFYSLYAANHTLTKKCFTYLLLSTSTAHPIMLFLFYLKKTKHLDLSQTGLFTSVVVFSVSRVQFNCITPHS